MMNHIELYFEPKENVYYFINSNNVTCTNCSSELFDVVFIKVVWDKLGSGVQYYCNKCVDVYQSDVKATFVERFGAMIVESVSRRCEFVLLSKPILKPLSDLSVFDSDSFDSDKVVDNTRFANRESWGGSSVGSLSYLKDDVVGLDDLQSGKSVKLLDNNSLNSLLLSYKNSVPVIEEKKKLLLENSNDLLKSG
jgi:hypothetical protein